MMPWDVATSMSALGEALENQYLGRAKPRPHVMRCLNPRPEDVATALRDLRTRVGPQNKIIFHLTAHGISSRPQQRCIFVVNNNGRVAELPLDVLRQSAGYPLVLVADCPSAGTILSHFYESERKEEILRTQQRFRGTQQTYGGSSAGLDEAASRAGGYASNGGAGGGRWDGAPLEMKEGLYFLGACADGEGVASHALLPTDILTSCLTTPERMALLWFMIEHKQHTDLHPLLLHLDTGRSKTSPMAQIKSALQVVTECIAWHVLPRETFTQLFRVDNTVASLFRGFILASRIIAALGATPMSYPPFSLRGDALVSNHPLWRVLDVMLDTTVAEMCRAVKPGLYANPAERGSSWRDYLDGRSVSWGLVGDAQGADLFENFPVLPFWHDALSAIDASILRDTTSYCHDREIPIPRLERLPALFYALLQKAHRREALRLLCRFVDLGGPSVAQLHDVDIFSIVITDLLKRPDQVAEFLPYLLFVAAKATFADPDLVSSELLVQVCLFAIKPTSSHNTPPRAAARAVLGHFADEKGTQVLALSTLVMLTMRRPDVQVKCIATGAVEAVAELLHRHCFANEAETGLGVPPPHLAPPPPLSRHHKSTSPPSMSTPSPPPVVQSGQGTPRPDVDSGGSNGIEPLLLTSCCAFMTAVLLGSSVVAVGGSINFGELVERLIPCVGVLLWHSAPAVRFAAARVMSVFVLHPEVPEEWTLKLVHLAVTRLEPLETNVDTRIELLSILSGTLRRHEGILKSTAHHEVAALLTPLTRPKGGMYSKSEIPIPSLMSPLALGTAMTAESTRTVTAAAPLQLVDSDDEDASGSAWIQQSPFNTATPKYSMPSWMRRSIPNVAGAAMAAAPVSTASDASPLMPPVPPAPTSRAIVLMCLHAVAVAADDICPIVRQHAARAMRELRDAKLIPAQFVDSLNQVGGGGGGGNGAGGVGPGVDGGSTKQQSGFWRFFSSVRGNSLAVPRDGGASRHAAQQISGISAGGSDHGNSSEVSDSFATDFAGSSTFNRSHRAVSHDDRTTIAPFIFACLSFLDELLLTPPDSYSDPRSLVVINKVNAARTFAESFEQSASYSCRQVPESWDIRFDIVQERDVAEGVRSVVFHPVQRHFVTSSFVGDLVTVWQLHDNEKRMTIANQFWTSSASRRPAGSGLNGGSAADVTDEPMTPMSKTPVHSSQARQTSSLFHQPLSNTNRSYTDAHISSMCIVDAPMRSLLCTTHADGGVTLFANYYAANRSATHRIAAFPTMPREEAANSHTCLSAYSAASGNLHVTRPSGAIGTWDLDCEQAVDMHFSLRSTTVSSICAHTTDRFMLAVGASGSVLLFDLRSPKRSCQAKAELPPSHSHKLPPQVVHVGFAPRFAHCITAGYAPDGAVALWDDRLLSRPLTLQTPSGAEMTKGCAVRHLDVHAIHPQIVSAHTTTAHDIVATEFGSNVWKKVAKPSLKQATTVVFHPVSVVFAVGSPKQLVLVARKPFDSSVARETLTM